MGEHRSELPVDDVLPRLLEALEDQRLAVLAAPPGAGKTTRVPPALAMARWAEGRRIVVLEPRRLAARAAAERMAAERGEAVGQTVGYRIRGDSRVGRGTRIEVVTEGVLTRMLQTDPELPGVAALVFDEVHERSIHSDLGLVLALEVQAALRPDLRILAMSATLDTARLAALMGNAPIIESAGRLHRVETRWLDRPWRDGRRRVRLEDACTALIGRALAETEGDLLVFLPGAGEIRRVAARLDPGPALVRPLYGALPFPQQRRALEPEPGRRRIVLSTAIAETSLTVPGVRVVVDAGRARRAETDPATGLTRLVTRPVSRAEAAQRQGRAGREAAGVGYRMWTQGEHGALPAFAPPEILTADLAPLALELAAWGKADPATLAFLDPPPAPALTEARALLTALGALDPEGRITPQGREMAAAPVHPRLAHMLLEGQAAGLGAEAALLAALVEERDVLAGGAEAGADLGTRLSALLAAARPSHPLDRAAAGRVLAEMRRLAKGRRPDPHRAVAQAGRLLAHAYPDRIALRREGEAPRYLMANGRGAILPPGDPLAAAALLVATDVEDTRPEATIRRAATLDLATLREIAGDRIAWHSEVFWDRRSRQVIARRQEKIGALVLAEQPWRDAPPDACAKALADGVRDLGLEAIDWPPPARRLLDRVRWLSTSGIRLELPDWSEDGLLRRLDEWLLPWLMGLRRIEQIGTLDLAAILAADLGGELGRAVDRAAPDRLRLPGGRSIPIDYARPVPAISVRVQDVFGMNRHPLAGDPPVPLLVELLSPAGRPVQTTQDLPGFWRGSYAEVRKEMKARYPKHHWPENPATAEPGQRRQARNSAR